MEETTTHLNFTPRKGDTLYVRVHIGKTIAFSGKEITVDKVVKKNDKIYSIRCTVNKYFRLEEGLDKGKPFKQTFRLDANYYQFFQTKSDFMASMEQALLNIKTICDNSLQELKEAF